MSTTLTIMFQVAFGIVHYLNIGLYYKSVPIVIICCQVFFLQLGLQTFPNLLSSELFPNDARSSCKGIIRAFSALSSAAMLKMFPYTETQIGNNRSITDIKYIYGYSKGFMAHSGFCPQFSWQSYPLFTFMCPRQKILTSRTLICFLLLLKQFFIWTFHLRSQSCQVTVNLVKEFKWLKIVLVQAVELWTKAHEFC